MRISLSGTVAAPELRSQIVKTFPLPTLRSGYMYLSVELVDFFRTSYFWFFFCCFDERLLQVAMVGLMAVNISGGHNCYLDNITIRATGNGGVYMNAGDRNTLTPSGHVLQSALITDYNRWTHCYTPGVVLAGVGNSVLNTTIHKVSPWLCFTPSPSPLPSLSLSLSLFTPLMRLSHASACLCL